MAQRLLNKRCSRHQKTDVIARSEATRQPLSGCSSAKRSRATASGGCHALRARNDVCFFGLAMTSVLLAIRRSEQNTYLVGVSVPEERSISTKGSARSFEPRELKWSLSRYRKLLPLSG